MIWCHFGFWRLKIFDGIHFMLIRTHSIDDNSSAGPFEQISCNLYFYMLGVSKLCIDINQSNYDWITIKYFTDC